MFTTPPNVYGHSYFNKVQEIIDNEDFTVQKFLILTLDPKQMERLEKNLRFIDETYVTSSSPFNLEVTHINGNKGYGLKAMGNAEEEVKLSCDLVTLSNDENGVAYAFEKYIFTESNVL